MSENTLFGEEAGSGVEYLSQGTMSSAVDDEQSVLSDESQRLLAVMRREGMNLSQFAAAIGIKISSLSHILNGRNNPSLDIMQRILRRFNYVNADWLILGRGEAPQVTDSLESGVGSVISGTSEHLEVSELRRSSEIPLKRESSGHTNHLESSDLSESLGSQVLPESSVQSNNFGGAESSETTGTQVLPESSVQSNNFGGSDSSVVPEISVSPASLESSVVSEVSQLSSRPHITKIIVYYSDNTFEQFCK